MSGSYGVQEVSSFSTCLPVTWESSVHVAVDEDRLDLLRILILPGQDTPYANGAFVFDAYLPPDYPNSHPKVQFLTTGGGRVRFNPNLYECGKVCLSLLGTWAGPSWQPGVSTFLQVLVSLQAMARFPLWMTAYFQRQRTVGGLMATFCSCVQSMISGTCDSEFVASRWTEMSRIQMNRDRLNQWNPDVKVNRTIFV